MTSIKQQINKYFNENSLEINTLQCINNYTNKIVGNIVNDITQGNININEIPLSVRKQKKSYSDDKNKQLIKKIINQKQEMILKLNNLYDQQAKLRAIKLQHQRSQKKSPQKSNAITPQEKQIISKLIKAKQDFQVNLQNKVKQTLQQAKEKQLQSQQQKQFKKKQKAKQRRIQQLKHHKQYQLQRKKYSLVLDKNIQKKKYYYKEIQQRYKTYQQQQENYKKMKYQQKKQRMKTDFIQLKQHALQHDQSLSRRKIQSQHQSINKSNVSNPKYQQTEFFKRIIKEQQQKKIQLLRKIRQKKEMAIRIKGYREYITQNFQPKINQKSKFIPKKMSSAKPHATLVERTQIGNKYLQIARKLKKSSDREDKTQEDILLNQQKSKKQYINYLKQLKANRKTSSSNQIQLQKIIHSSTLTDHNVRKAIQLTKKIQSSQKIHPNNSVDIKLAQNKILILQAILKNQIK